MICKNCGAHFDDNLPKCVLKSTRENAQKYIRIAIVCVMIVLLILSFLFLGFSWNIASALSSWQASVNSEKYCAMLDQYEEEGDFLSFDALCLDIPEEEMDELSYAKDEIDEKSGL